MALTGDPTLIETQAPAPSVGNSITPPATAPRSEPITDDIRDDPARVLGGAAAWDHFGSQVVALGDLNGDGSGELGIVSRNPWSVHIQVGSQGGFQGISTVTLSGAAEDLFGVQVAAGGDLNGDGLGDFAVTVGHLDGATGAYRYEIRVFYGAAQLTGDLSTTTVEAPGMAETFGSGLAIVPGLDGDGFADLVATAPPQRGTSAHGTAWAFRGSASGVDTRAAWTFTHATGGVPFGAGASSAGDLNGDGRGDFVVTTGGEPALNGRSQMFVFYGAADLDIVDPAVITGEQEGDSFGSALASGDFNADGRSDLLVGSPGHDSSTEQVDAGRVYEYRGSAQGLILNYASVRSGLPGTKYATAVASIGDLSGDGIEDAAVGAPLASANGPVTNGQFFIYFGSSNGLATTYDLTEAGDAGNDLFGISLAGRFDLDSDGRVDLAVGASGRDAGGFTDSGATYLYSGALLRMPAIASSAFVVEGLTNGKVLARAPDPYVLSLTFVYRGDPAALSRVEFSVVARSLPAPISFVWSSGTGTVLLVGEPTGLVEQGPGSSLASSAPLKHSYRLRALAIFGWQFTDPNPVTVESSVRDLTGATAQSSTPNAFSVVATLAFSRPLEVWSDGTLVGNDAYVKGGTRIHWAGGGLFYTGTPVVPSSEEVAVSVVNEAGTAAPASLDPLTGDINADETVKITDDPSDLHDVRALATTGAVLAEAARVIRVDASSIVFGPSSPVSGRTVAQDHMFVSVLVADGASGPDGGSFEWAVSYSSDRSFSLWQPATLIAGATTSVGADVPLFKGPNNFIKFRGSDQVGNGPTESPQIQLILDFGAPEFAQTAPAPDAWIRSANVEASFTVTNPLGQLDLSSLVCSVNDGPWVNLGVAGQASTYAFSLTLALQDGAHNRVSFHISNVAMTGSSDSVFLFKVDTQPLEFEFVSPSPGTWVTTGSTNSVVRITDATSGVAAASVHYRYLPPGAGTWSGWLAPSLEPTPGGFLARGGMPLGDGVDNFVQWQADDTAGNGPISSLYQRVLSDTRSVRFENAVPSDGAFAAEVNRLSIEVTDGDGSGVDLSTVEFQVFSEAAGPTQWINAAREGLATRAVVSVAFVLPAGVSTIRWRAQDAAHTPLSTSAALTITVLAPQLENAVPRVLLREPLTGVHYPAGVDIKFDARPSFDPEGATLAFAWWIDGRPVNDHSAFFWASLPPGTHTVTLKATDGTTSSLEKTVEFTVDPPVGAPSPFSTSIEQVLAISFAGLLCAALAARVWSERLRKLVRR